MMDHPFRRRTCAPINGVDQIHTGAQVRRLNSVALGCYISRPWRFEQIDRLLRFGVEVRCIFWQASRFLTFYL